MAQITAVTARLFSELVYGAPARGGAFVLNSGDLGLLRRKEGTFT